MLRQDLHVDPDEAQEIVRLAARQQASPLSEGPTVEGLAEALNLPPEEVQRLLNEVRQRKAAAVQAQMPPQRQFGDRSAALSAGIVLALVVVVAVIGFGAYMMFSVKAAPADPAAIVTPSIRVQVGNPNDIARIPEGDSATVTVPATPPVTPPPATASSEDDKAAADKLRRSLDAAGDSLKANPGGLSPQDQAEAQKAFDDAKAELDKKAENRDPASASSGH